MTTSSTRRIFAFSLTLALMGGCSEKDETAPPAPNVDPVATPTSLPTQMITGAAEYGATVRITGGLRAVETTADPFTAEFRADIELITDIPVGAERVATTLTLVAVDSSGNESDPTTVVIEYEEPHPEGLVLELSRDQITADEGEVLATVRTVNDELTDLSGFDVVFTLSGVPGIAPADATQTVQTNSSGVARATFSGLTSVSDAASITATASDLSDSRTFRIVAGRAAEFATFELTGAAADGTIVAGEDVTYDYATVDAFGNSADGHVLVTVDDPNAVVFDDGLSGSGALLGLTRVGTYTMSARIGGSGRIATQTITVQTAPGARFIDLTLTLTRMAVGSTVLALTVTRDGYGNVITSPAPTFTIEAQNPATTDFYSQSGAEFTVTKSGVYIITATFDDGANAAASDFEYLLVEDIPDLEPPTISIARINGFGVCPGTGLTTDQPDLSDCATRTEPALILRRNTWAVVELDVRDNRSLTRVAYKAFGSGVSQEDFTLIGDGQYTAGTTLPVVFSFRVNINWLGDVTVVGQASDGAGNSSNSAAAFIRVRLDLTSPDDRSVEVIGTGEILRNVWDVAVAPDGSIFTINRDSALPVLYQLDPDTGLVTASIDTYPNRAEFIAFDALGNVYLTMDQHIPSGNNLDEVWMGVPGELPSLYLPDQGNGFDPEGLATLGAIPARGGWRVPQSLNDDACLGAQIGAEPDPGTTRGDTYVVQLSSDCAAQNACNGSGALAGLTPDACLDGTGGSATQRQTLTDHLNTVRGTTGLSAFIGQNCFNTTDPCVFLVADTAGTAPSPAGGLPIRVRTSDGNWPTRDVDRGEDAGVLYVVDGNNDEVLETQTPPTAGSAVLRTYTVPNVNGNLVDVAAALRMTADEMTSDATRSERMFLFLADDGDRLLGYDSGRDDWWTVEAGGRLNQPESVVYVPFDDADGNDTLGGGCLITTTRGNNRDELLAYTDIDNLGGATLEGGAEMVTGFDRLRGLALDTTDADPANWTLLAVDENLQAVVRIGRTTDPDDCF